MRILVFLISCSLVIVMGCATQASVAVPSQSEGAYLTAKSTSKVSGMPPAKVVYDSTSKENPMAKGICISIGLNSVNPGTYGGWDGTLRGCENDARDIAAMAVSKGYEVRLLLTKEATAGTVLAELQRAAKALSPGDALVLFYSGHGGQVGDVNGDEEDQIDETWCLYDRMLVDDELYSMWSKFPAGVRIFVMSDSCHSGTVTKYSAYRGLVTSPSLIPYYDDTEQIRFKAIPSDKSWAIYQKNKTTYDTVQYLSGAGEKITIVASVILISGCQDNQLSADGFPNSLFTATVKKVWNNGQFNSGYRKFHQAIVEMMPPSQSPSYFVVGTQNLAFEAQQPFVL